MVVWCQCWRGIELTRKCTRLCHRYSAVQYCIQYSLSRSLSCLSHYCLSKSFSTVCDTARLTHTRHTSTHVKSTTDSRPFPSHRIRNLTAAEIRLPTITPHTRPHPQHNTYTHTYTRLPMWSADNSHCCTHTETFLTRFITFQIFLFLFLTLSAGCNFIFLTPLCHSLIHSSDCDYAICIPVFMCFLYYMNNIFPDVASISNHSLQRLDYFD